MWLLEVIFIACLATALSGSAGEVKLPIEQAFVPRYTPESKRQDLDLPATGQNLEEQLQQQPQHQHQRPLVAGDKKPWRRRVDYGYDGVSTAAWSAAPSPPAAILSILNPLLAPGLLLLGVNLGALLYMLLGLLGLAPHRGSSRAGSISHAWPNHNDEILYRHNLDEGGKETAVYF